MKYALRLRRVAQCEFDGAVDWYEARRAGLGLRFTAAVQKTMLAIATRPERFPEVMPGVREARVSKWPYCIYYQIHDEQVSVIAVFHTSRNPADWQGRT